MDHYKNSYFGVSVPVLANWKLRYWGNRTKKLDNSELFQSCSDELPTKAQPSKELFSMLRSRESKNEAMLSGIFSMVALYRSNTINALNEVEVFDSEVKRDIRSVIVSGKSAQCINLEYLHEGSIFYREIYYWQYQPNIWLGSYLQGSTLENFNEAKNIFSASSF
jgi:hypothetical protein